MTGALLIGIDVGTSSVKVGAYSNDGKQLHASSSPIHIQKTEEWLRAIREALPRNIPFGHYDKKIVSVDGTSGSFVLVDEYGNSLMDPVMYYEKAPEEYNEIKDLSSVKKLEEKGITIEPEHPIVKLLRIKTKMPDIYRKARWVVPQATWILYRLLYSEGEKWEDISVDYSNALKFGLDITLEKPEWFKPLFEEVGIDMDKLPRVVPSGTYAGVAASKYSETMGLSGSELYHGTTDGNAAALACGALEKGDLVIYSGTTTVPKYIADKIVLHKALYYHVHPLKGYLAGAATSETGGFLSWFVEKVVGVEIEDAVKMAESIGDGETPIFYPSGSRSPFYDPYMKATLAGLSTTESDRNRVIGLITKGIILGITLTEYFYIDLIEKLFNTSIEEVKITGGTTRARFWNVIRASVFGKKVLVYGEQVAIGTLIPAMVRSKMFENTAEIRNKFLKIVDEVEPNPDLVVKYEKMKSKFYESWEILREFYRA